MARPSYRERFTRRSVQLDEKMVFDLDKLAELFKVSDAEILRQVIRLGLVYVTDKIKDTPAADALTVRTTLTDAIAVEHWIENNAN